MCYDHLQVWIENFMTVKIISGQIQKVLSGVDSESGYIITTKKV